ncbi:EAL domain-containing protein [Herbaspirillum aquaticum]|uniref:EAL domain-containing protein n=1 Tax=Herbaspirillum aquaticum TaxID=568783 RepID=UPI0024DE4D70|nr:EAL domain-containing protein [Herbaspirillum aquaticum]
MNKKAHFKRAIQRNEFIVVYQPIVALADGSCTGAEVLVRWQREDGALLGPDRFLPDAQRHGYLAAITDLVLAQTLADMAPILRSHPGLHLAVNIPAQDINSGRILKVIEHHLAGASVAPRQLWLEITEGSSMETAACRSVMEQLRRNGHLLALDDFGTGYSSLRYLHELPCDVLKLDRSFVTSIGTELPPHPVLGCIIDLARQLKLKIVAEGVETAVQARYLEKQAVDYAQGWHYARPMLAAEFARHCGIHALLSSAPAAPAVHGGPLSVLALDPVAAPVSAD